MKLTEISHQPQYGCSTDFHVFKDTVRVFYYKLVDRDLHSFCVDEVERLNATGYDYRVTTKGHDLIGKRVTYPVGTHNSPIDHVSKIVAIFEGSWGGDTTVVRGIIFEMDDYETK